MDPDLAISILREIAAQHGQEGADEGLIRDGLDHSERAGVSAPDLAWTLARLTAAGCIEQRGERWYLTPALAAELPRTRSGQMSLGSAAWRRFTERRIKPLFRP